MKCSAHGEHVPRKLLCDSMQLKRDAGTRRTRCSEPGVEASTAAKQSCAGGRPQKKYMCVARCPSAWRSVHQACASANMYNETLFLAVAHCAEEHCSATAVELCFSAEALPTGNAI
jgi:hypothetical protein